MHTGEDHSFEVLDRVQEDCELESTPDCAVLILNRADFTRTEFIDSNFGNANFNGAILSFADISDSNFSNTTFLTDSLIEANLNDITISKSDFTDARFGDGVGDGASATTMRRAIVHGGTFDGADFRNVDLSDTQFQCINVSVLGGAPTNECSTFVGADFQGADLTAVRFSPTLASDEYIFTAADFLGATLTDTTITTLAEPCMQVDAVMNEWSCIRIGHESPGMTTTTTVDGLALTNSSDLRGVDMRNLTIDRSNFSGVLIAGTRFDGATVTDTNFSSVDTTCNLGGGTTEENGAEDDLCNFFAADAIDKADFRDASMTNANFADATLSNATFADDPLITDNDLGASLTNVVFARAILEGTDFTNAVMTNVDFERANLGCGNSPTSFADNCGNCADFTDVFLEVRQIPAVDGNYNISMTTVEFDDYIACSVLAAAEPGGKPLIADLSHVRLDLSSFTATDVTSVNFTGASLVSALMNEAVITGVNFDDADMRLALFNDITTACTSAGVGCASFVGTDLSFAGMRRGVFAGANFDDAVFDGTVTDRSDFNTATFGDDDTDGDGTSFKAAIISGSTFNNAMFNNADLTNAVALCLGVDCASFVGATFTDSILENANFRGADLSETQFINSDLTGANFSEAIFSADTSFGTSKIDGLNLEDVDLSVVTNPHLFLNITDPDPADPSAPLGVNLDSNDVSGFNFSGRDLRNWSLNGATITGATFTGADLNGAVLTNIAFTNEFLAQFTDKHFFAGARLTNTALSDLNLAGKNFTSTNLSGATVTRSSFVDANFTNANLTNLNSICDSSNECAEITGATLNCANFDGTDPTDFFVRDVADVVGQPGALQADENFFKFVNSNLDGVKLRSRSFLGYDLSSLGLAGADLNSSEFRGADLRGTDLSGAKLTDSTFCDTTTPGPGICSTFGNDTVSLTTLSTFVDDPMDPDDDCNEYQAANFTRVNFSNAPRNLFEGTITGGSVACVNFTDADLSTDDLNSPARGFDFGDLTDWQGAVLAGANLRFQDFATTNTGDIYQDFFLQLSREKTPNDICTIDDDDAVEDIAPGADLSSTVFSCANLTGQKMSDSANPADLRGAAFIRTTIGGTGFSFEGAQVDGINFSNVDFSEASLVNVFQDVDTVKLDNSNAPFEDEGGMAYPNLQNLNLSFANLSSINLSHVDLSDARLDGTNFDNANLTDAILDDIVSLCAADPNSTALADTCLPLNNTTPTCMTIAGARLSGASLQGTDFTTLIFDQSVDSSPDGEFFQVVADKDLSGVDFTRSGIAGMNFSGMNLTDAIISTAQRICDSSIIPGEDGCANFQNAILGSSDPNAPLSFLTLNPGSVRFNFRGSNLVGATFTNVNLVNVEFDDIGNICETVDPAPENCLTIKGQNSSLFGSNLEGLDVKLIDFGDPEQEGSAGAMIDFQLVNFTLADFSTTSLTKRNMRGANFTGANLHLVDFSESILAEIISGCTGGTCTNFDDTTLRGVDAEGARIEGSFNNVDASPVAASMNEPEKPSRFDNAVFIGVDLSTANFSKASMEGATFDSGVLFCVETACVNFNGASLVAGNMRGLNFDHALPGLFAEIKNHDLSQVDFTGSDISGKEFMDTKLDFADLSQTDLRGANFRNASFIETEFALGGVTDGDVCTLPLGGSRVDLRGADLRGADLSRARNFQAGCILVDATTLYNQNTKFPAGFALLDTITIPEPDSGTITITIPEPSRGLLQVTALLSLAALLRRRRSRGIQ